MVIGTIIEEHGLVLHHNDKYTPIYGAILKGYDDVNKVMGGFCQF